MKNFLAIFSVLVSSAGVAAQRPGTEVANVFQCKGDGISINYASTSKIGQPSLAVEEKDQDIVFKVVGTEVKRTEVPMGNLVTGTYFKHALADGPTYHYSLIVPLHELTHGEKITLKSQLLKTTVVSGFRRPGTFQVSNVEVFPLECEAEQVIF